MFQRKNVLLSDFLNQYNLNIGFDFPYLNNSNKINLFINKFLSTGLIYPKDLQKLVNFHINSNKNNNNDCKSSSELKNLFYMQAEELKKELIKKQSFYKKETKTFKFILSFKYKKDVLLSLKNCNMLIDSLNSDFLREAFSYIHKIFLNLNKNYSINLPMFFNYGDVIYAVKINSDRNISSEQFKITYLDFSKWKKIILNDTINYSLENRLIESLDIQIQSLYKNKKQLNIKCEYKNNGVLSIIQSHSNIRLFFNEHQANYFYSNTKNKQLKKVA